jgi:thiol-disulfide isomerase/thioredoxin
LLEPGRVLLRLNWLATYVQTQHADFADVEGQGAIPIVHDQDLAITEARLALDLGITRRFSASLMLPVRLVSTRIHYLDGSGTNVDLVTPSTHHRNETLSGVADPMLLGAVSETWGGLRITVRAGASIPLGRTEHDPFANADVPHQHIQMGTGTFNPVVSLEAGYEWAKWRAAAFGYTQQTFYENAKGYQAGDRYATGVALRRALGKWNVRGGLEMQAETYETWNDMRYTDEGNQGRIDAMVATGASWAATDRLSFDASLKVPFINHVVNGQLRMPALLEIGAAWTFGTIKPSGHDHEHADHDHDHEHEHIAGEATHGDGPRSTHAALDTSGADVADLGKGGARVDLVPVAGKVTIFDFWAEWCVPCKTLEPVLVELAKKYPSRVALRRIDVIDWDSAVVAQHLTPGGFNLPHLKIFDGNGRVLLEDSSGPGKLIPLIEHVRALVEPESAPASEQPAPVEQPPLPVPSEPAPDVSLSVESPTPPAESPTTVAAQAPKRPAVKRFSITVTEKGFEPAALAVPRGTPVVLTFHRKTDKTCATEVIFEHDGKKVMKELPLGKPVSIELTFQRAASITYACAMNMIRGTLNVR